MTLNYSTPVNVITPPTGDVQIKSKVWLTTTSTAQATAFIVRKGATLLKLEAQVESTNLGSVTLSVGSPTTTNHYVSAFALSTNAYAVQLPTLTANLLTQTELTQDLPITAQLSGAPGGGKVILNLYLA